MGARLTPTGRMPHRVEIQKPRRTTDATGQAADDWDPPAARWERWAAVEGLSGRELLQAEQVQSEASKKVRVWGADLAGLDTTCRVVWAGGVLLVEAVVDADGKRTQLELWCKATT
jgi:SPP1 family predicted phage head-tail adaptor